jgi:hypothetical protein
LYGLRLPRGHGDSEDDLEGYDWNDLEGGQARVRVQASTSTPGMYLSASLYREVVWTKLGREEMIDKW